MGLRANVKFGYVMPNSPYTRAGHWCTYSAPEEAPPLLLDTVDELEFRLRLMFPGVFRAAEVRRQLHQNYGSRGSSILY